MKGYFKKSSLVFTKFVLKYRSYLKLFPITFGKWNVYKQPEYCGSPITIILNTCWWSATCIYGVQLCVSNTNMWLNWVWLNLVVQMKQNWTMKQYIMTFKKHLCRFVFAIIHWSATILIYIYICIYIQYQRRYNRI